MQDKKIIKFFNFTSLKFNFNFVDLTTTTHTKKNLDLIF